MGKRSRKTANATRKRVLSASNGVVKATEERKPGKVVDTAKILASNPTPEVVNQPHEPVNRQSSSNIPLALEMILPLLSQKQQILVKILCSSLLGQAHIFEQWPVDGDAEKKIECVRQLESFHDSYSAGGLTGFILEAMKKPKKTSNMAKSSDVILEFQDLNSLGFVYVDKGEGKNITGLDNCISVILELQKLMENRRLSLCLMSSSHETMSNLHGLEEDQVAVVPLIMKQPKLDSDMKLVISDCYTIHAEDADYTQAVLSMKSWSSLGIHWVVIFDGEATPYAFDCESVSVQAYCLDSKEEVNLVISVPSFVVKQQTEEDPPSASDAEDVTVSISCGHEVSVKHTKSELEFSVNDLAAATDIPSLTSPADAEVKERKASDDCSCAIL